MIQGYIIALATFWLQTYERKFSYTLMELAISYGNIEICQDKKAFLGSKYTKKCIGPNMLVTRTF